MLDSVFIDILLELILFNGIVSGCIISIILMNYSEFIVEINFVAGLVEDCIYFIIDIVILFLWCCFFNDIVVYYSNFFNIGVVNVIIEVVLDFFLVI